jgi:hypothetical protein
MKSLWRSRYEIVRNDNVVFTATEENPWAKVGDHFFEGIPLIGMLSGYIFHPRYAISEAHGTTVIRATKQPAFMESVFTIERVPAPLSADDERLLLIGAVTMILLERRRG